MFKRILIKASSNSLISAALNFVTVILTIRLLGSELYNKYIIDLAMIGILSIALELLPSNFSLFKVQDDSFWKNIVGVQIVISSCLNILITLILGIFFSVFEIFSYWLAIYVLGLGLKRYQDIILQVKGRVDEFFKLEILIALVRLGLFFLFWKLKFSSITTLWASLAIAMLVVQLIWFYKNKSELSFITQISNPKIYKEAWLERNQYFPYYLGIGLKRIKDNSIPIVAKYFFSSADALAGFFLAYRGIAFSLGQIRIIEAVINNRQHLKTIENMSLKFKLLVALMVQLISVIFSIVLQVWSGIKNIDLFYNLLLSLLVYPITFSILERSKAYSKYDANAVNISIISYLVVLVIGLCLVRLLIKDSEIGFSIILILSELAVFVTLIDISNDRNSNV